MSQLNPVELTDDEPELANETLSFQNGTQVVNPSAPKPKWELKKLTAKHKRIVQLKVSGLERTDIAKMCGCTPEYVSMLMQQPLVQNLYKELHRRLDEDLFDLSGPAVETLRHMIDSADDKVALAAATTVLKANGKLGKDQIETHDTAEDVVAKIFQISGQNVQINLTTKE